MNICAHLILGRLRHLLVIVNYLHHDFVVLLRLSQHLF
jgi:hypothetical protein